MNNRALRVLGATLAFWAIGLLGPLVLSLFVAIYNAVCEFFYSLQLIKIHESGSLPLTLVAIVTQPICYYVAFRVSKKILDNKNIFLPTLLNTIAFLVTYAFITISATINVGFSSNWTAVVSLVISLITGAGVCILAHEDY